MMYPVFTFRVIMLKITNLVILEHPAQSGKQVILQINKKLKTF